MKRSPAQMNSRGFLFYRFTCYFAFLLFPGVLRCARDPSRPNSVASIQLPGWYDARPVTILPSAKHAATLPKLELCQPNLSEARLMVPSHHNALPYRLPHRSSQIPDCPRRLSGGLANHRPAYPHPAYGRRPDELSSHLYPEGRKDLLSPDTACEM